MANSDYLNKVELIGNLGKDPEVRYTPGGHAVASLSLATQVSYKNQTTDDWEQKTQWHNITAWRDLAETASDTLQKGDRVHILGSIEYQSWEDRQSGDKKYKTVIVAKEIEKLDKPERGERGEKNSGQRRRGDAVSSKRQSSEEDVAAPVQIIDDDIPF